jgi:hypothetical protein
MTWDAASEQKLQIVLNLTSFVLLGWVNLFFGLINQHYVMELYRG